MRILKLTRAAAFTVFIMAIGHFSNLNAQCATFFCNDTVYVSVNAMCSATITPDILLEDQDTALSCVYEVIITDPITNQVIVGNTIDDQTLFNRPIKVSVRESGVANPNSCWGIIVLEDKLPPDIICAGNDTILCTTIDTLSQEISLRAYLKAKVEVGLIDNCGNEEIEIRIVNNQFIDDCDEPFVAMRVVDYQALDIALNKVECTDTIFYIKVPLDSIDAPKNYTHDMALDCDSPDPTVEYLLSIDSETPGNNSVPNIDGISIADLSADGGAFTERGTCKFKISYTDLPRFALCGNTFKIIRRWEIVDWCDPQNPRFIHQLIETRDNEVIINDNSCIDITDQSADPITCLAPVTLNRPVVALTECNTWTWSIFVREPGASEFVAFGAAMSNSTESTSRNFALGTSTVRYVVEDACENTDTCEYTVTVIDDQPPVAVCDYRTVVTLNANFLAKVTAQSFDDGSYDLCSGIASYKVRRKDRGTTSCETPTDFDDFIKFCCEDVGKTILVELQVTDGNGMTATCWAEAVVQFQGPGPVITCPANLPTQDCRTYADFDINTLSAPMISSPNPCIAQNLTPTLREVDRTIDDCGVGYIDVEWLISLTNPNEVICAQRIAFSNLDPVTLADLNFPGDRTVEACSSTDPTQAELDGIFDSNTPCAMLQSPTFEDVITAGNNGVCQRIRRTYTVVDWCQFNSTNGSVAGLWTGEQIIEVMGSADPIFDNEVSSVSITFDQANCRGTVTSLGLATDDCTALSDLIWTYQVDLVSGAASIPIIPTTSGRELVRTLDVGTYRINWTVSDGCGNTQTASKDFEILDTEKPDVQCIETVEANIAANTQTYVLSVNDVNDGSSDNCDFQLSLGLRRANTNDPLTSTLTFTCNEVGVRQLELHATDDAGNTDFCVIFISLQDAEGACGFGANRATVAGNIITPNDVAIENAQIVLTNRVDERRWNSMTSTDGEYVFSQLGMYQDYEIAVDKNDDLANGVSTLDLVLIQRHILGIRDFTTPYQIIAADANNSESITAADLVVLRKVILGLIDELPNNSSWRFVKKDFEFVDVSNPWPFEEEVELVNVEKDQMKNDFVGIKIGDVDQNAIANSGLAKSRSNQTKKLIQNVSYNSGVKRLSFSLAERLNVSGMQLFFNIGQDVSAMSVSAEGIKISNENYTLQDGIFKMSWSSYGSTKLIENQAFLTIEIPENVGAINHDLVQVGTGLQSELYTSDFESYSLSLESNIEGGFEVSLEQNRPNPFSDHTVIEYSLPSNEQVTFSIFTTNGTVIYETKPFGRKGNNKIELNKEELGLNKGIYYYQLKSENRSLVRKMISL